MDMVSELMNIVRH